MSTLHGAVELEQSLWHAPWLVRSRGASAPRLERPPRAGRRVVATALAVGTVAGLLLGIEHGAPARGTTRPPVSTARVAEPARQRAVGGEPLAEWHRSARRPAIGHGGAFGYAARVETRVPDGQGARPTHDRAFMPTLPDRTAGLLPPADPRVVEHVSGREILRGDETTGAMALTFDCEGTGEHLHQVLDILASHRARGTFFLLAAMAQTWPEAVARVVTGGHQLASHGSSHDDYRGLSQEAIALDLEVMSTSAVDALQGQGIVPPAMRFFRFPFGLRDERSLAAVAEAGYQSVFWTIDPRGWLPSRTVPEVMAIVEEHAGPGEILLMHCSAPTDRAALPNVLALMAERGLRTATIAEIARWEDLSPADAPSGRSAGGTPGGAAARLAPGAP